MRPSRPFCRCRNKTASHQFSGNHLSLLALFPFVSLPRRPWKMATATVADLAKAACLTEADINYLAAKGYSSIAMIARSAKDDTEFLRRIVEPFCAGVELNNIDYKASGDADLVEARFLVLFEESRTRGRSYSPHQRHQQPPQHYRYGPRRARRAPFWIRKLITTRWRPGKARGHQGVLFHNISSKAPTTSFFGS